MFFFRFQLVNLGVIVYLTQLLEVNPFSTKVTLKNMTLTFLLDVFLSFGLARI